MNDIVIIEILNLLVLSQILCIIIFSLEFSKMSNQINQINIKLSVLIILFFGLIPVLLSAATDPALFLNATRFSEVNIISNVKFATVKNYKGLSQDLMCDIYQPAGDVSKDRPCILWIHGGGFRSDSKRTQNYIVNYATAFAKRGFVCISIDYRLRDGVDLPSLTHKFPALQDAARDANTALDWIRTNAAHYKINLNCLFIAGGSAGGETALTTANYDGPDSTATTKPENKYKNKLWNKKGLIAAGILWGGEESELRGWTYPYLAKNPVPTVIIHGEIDKTILAQNSIDLAEALTKVGVTNELHIIPEMGHTPTGAKTDPLIENWLGDFFVKEWIKAIQSKKEKN
jgi:acetyl esterase/lipase